MRGMRRRKAHVVFAIKARLIVDGAAAQVFAALQGQVAAAHAAVAKVADTDAVPEQVRMSIHANPDKPPPFA